MSKRRGNIKGGATAPPPPEVAVAGASASSTSSTSYDDNDGEKSQKLAKEAVRSIRDCYKICFASVLADVVITIIDHDVWNKFFHPGPDDDEGSVVIFGYLFWMDLVDSFAFFIFACALWRISLFYVKLVHGGLSRDGEPRKIKDGDFHALLRTMSLAWGLVAFNFAFVTVTEAAALPAHARDGPFHSLLGEVSSEQPASAATCIVVLCIIAVKFYCHKIAHSADAEDNKRISLHQQKSKNNITFQPTRRVAYKSYTNQAFCAMAFALKAGMELIKWVVDADGGGVIGRVLSISDVLAPFAIAWLLFTLNKSFIRAAVARLRSDGTNAIDEVLYNDLFIKQTGFYDRVAETMKEATKFRLLPYFVRPLWPTILSAMEGVSPWLAEKVVQILDILS